MKVILKQEAYQNDTNLKEVLNLSGDGKTGMDLTEEMFKDVYGFERKTDILWNESTKKFQFKTNKHKFIEQKEKAKIDLLIKSNNDPEFIFGKENIVLKYNKNLEKIEKSKNKTELKKIKI